MISRQPKSLFVLALVSLGLLLAALPALAGTGIGSNPTLETTGQPSNTGGTGYLGEDIATRFTLSAIGDSLTDNGTLHGILYDRLNNADFAYRSIPGGTSVNWHGLPGGTTGSILESTWAHDWGYGEGANFVIIMAGTNDIDYNRHDNITDLANAMVANVQEMVDSVLGGQSDRNSRPAVIVMGIPCYTDPDWTARAKVYNDLLRANLKHIDIFSDANWYSLYDSNTKAASESLMEDVKHPNDDGFYRIAENDFTAIDALYNTKRISASNHIYKGDWYFQRQ